MPVPDVIECARNVLHARPALLKGFTVLLPSAYLAPSQGSAGVGVSKDGHHMEKGHVVVIDLETLEETTVRSANGLDAVSRLTQSREKSPVAVPEDRQQQPVHAQQSQRSSIVASGTGSAESQVHDESLPPLAKTKSKSSSRSEGKKQKRKKSGRTSEPLGEEDAPKAKKRKVEGVKGKESSVSDPACISSSCVG
jgi:hypothetical protein